MCPRWEVSALSEVAIVTGGARGIGGAIAHGFATAGLEVVVADRESPAETAGYSSGSVHWVECDVTDTTAVESMVAEAVGVGRLVRLVHCAGVIGTSGTAELTDEVWQRVQDVHLGGAMRCARAAFPHLRESQGSVVLIGSIVGRLGLPRRLAYGTAKAGLEGFTRCLAAEWAPEGIRVNAVAPGYVDTPLLATARSAGADVDRVVSATPLGRLGTPSDIANVVMFLGSSAADFVTGQVITVDGGLAMAGTW